MLSSSVATACSDCFLSFLKAQVPAVQGHNVITSSHLKHHALFLQSGCLPPHCAHPQRPPGCRPLHSWSQSAGSEQQHSTEGHGPSDMATECDVMPGKRESVYECEQCEHACQALYLPTPTMSPKDPMENSGFSMVPVQASTPSGCQ